MILGWQLETPIKRPVFGLQTVDDRKFTRLRSSFHRLTFVCCFLLLFFSSCKPGDSTVTIALMGDINLGRGVTPSMESFDFLGSYLSSADLALANLESPLANLPPLASEQKVYNLCVLDPPTKMLASWGLDLLSIANNHRYDCGPDGDYETASLLSNAGLLSIGLDSDPVRLEVNGVSLAFFAYDDISSSLDGDAAAKAVLEARENGALPVISIHWGAEYQGAPSDRQEEIAHKFEDAGAVLLWGHHPHVLQPCLGCTPAHLRGSVVLYSLGNALFDQTGLSDTRQSALVLVTLDSAGVKAVQVVPFEIDTMDSRIVAADAETTKKILERLQIP